MKTKRNNTLRYLLGREGFMSVQITQTSALTVRSLGQETISQANLLDSGSSTRGAGDGCKTLVIGCKALITGGKALVMGCKALVRDRKA
jgi:hypothetical protein